MGYTHARNSGFSEGVARRSLRGTVNRWFSDPLSGPAARDPI